MSPNFPLPVRQRGHLYFWRSDLEGYKSALAGLPPKELDDNEIDVLVPAAKVAIEFGFCRRTLGRRVLEAEAAKSGAQTGETAAA